MRNKISLVKILSLIALLLAATVQAKETASTVYVEKYYFTVEIPAGWEKVDTVFGLSQEEKKVYGADFLAAGDSNGIFSRISVHYYANGNMIQKTAEKFIKAHAGPILGVVDDGESYGPIKDGLVAGHQAKIFERNLFEYVPPESINQKKIPIYEKFAVVPVKAGFYVLSLYSPTETSKTNLKAYGSVLASFKRLR